MASLRRFICITGIVLAACSPAVGEEKVVRFVPHANLTVLDPIWTTASVARNHGYMVYDTLFARDSRGAVRPQMVEQWSVGEDGRLWTFTLREGLEFHDGSPVTSNDVIASLKRWAGRDPMGRLLAGFVDRWETVDARTFALRLRERCGIVLDALGKSGANVPFIVPARIAAADGFEQVREAIGSGPFVFKADEFRPGEKVVYEKNRRYRPRTEPADGLAGGKLVHVDRVEWRIIRDPQTQLRALQAGEIDIIEHATHAQAAALEGSAGVRLLRTNTVGFQYFLRLNHLHPPFDDPRIRRAAMLAIGQEAALKTQVGTPGMYRRCRSIFPCGSPLASEDAGHFTGVADPKAAARLLRQAGYRGEPVVLLWATDNPAVDKVPPVLRQQLEAAGFKVDLQRMDWASLQARRARKDPPQHGGWSAFVSATADADNPLTMQMLDAAGASGWVGWQDEPRLQQLKAEFAKTDADDERRALASRIQSLALDTVSHVPLGEFFNVSAVRDQVAGYAANAAGVPVFWGVSKR